MPRRLTQWKLALGNRDSSLGQLPSISGRLWTLSSELHVGYWVVHPLTQQCFPFQAFCVLWTESALSMVAEKGIERLVSQPLSPRVILLFLLCLQTVLICLPFCDLFYCVWPQAWLTAAALSEFKFKDTCWHPHSAFSVGCLWELSGWVRPQGRSSRAISSLRSGGWLLWPLVFVAFPGLCVYMCRPQFSRDRWAWIFMY